jgi:threonine dehydratase
MNLQPSTENSDAAARIPTSLRLSDLHAAAMRIAGHVVRTPVVEAPAISTAMGCRVRFKCENLQHGWAFKSRGATNAVLSLSVDEAARGVVTHSSGNHAAALARAAKLRGIAAHIVMPRNSARVKLDAVRALGVEPILCEPDSASREAAAEDVRQRTGATLIHPFNDVRIIAGQASVGLEILEQAPDVDTVIVPVGGGGLLSGTLLAIKLQRPDVRVFAAEPEWADDAARSVRSGRIEPALRTDTVADGLRTPLGDLTFPIIQRLVDGVLCASEEAIRAATRQLFREARLVSEPSGAVPLAVIREHRDYFAGHNVVAVISGGNLDDLSLVS